MDTHRLSSLKKKIEELKVFTQLREEAREHVSHSIEMVKAVYYTHPMLVHATLLKSDFKQYQSAHLSTPVVHGRGRRHQKHRSDGYLTEGDDDEDDPHLLHVKHLLRSSLQECVCVGIQPQGDSLLTFLRDSLERLSDYLSVRTLIRRSLRTFASSITRQLMERAANEEADDECQQARQLLVRACVFICWCVKSGMMTVKTPLHRSLSSEQAYGLKAKKCRIIIMCLSRLVCDVGMGYGKGGAPSRRLKGRCSNPEFAFNQSSYSWTVQIPKLPSTLSKSKPLCYKTSTACQILTNR